jgi:hypothetical protein
MMIEKVINQRGNNNEEKKAVVANA